MGRVGNEEVEEGEGEEEEEAEMHTKTAADPTEGPKSGCDRMRTTTQQEGGGGGGAFGGVMERGESRGLGEGIQMMGHKGSLVRRRRLDCRLRNRILLLLLLLLITIIILQGCGNLCGCSLRNNGEMGRV